MAFNFMNLKNEKMEDKILDIIKEESENADVRKYTCINGWGYSQFERNIADRAIKLFAIHSVVCSACGEEIPEHEKDFSLLSQMSKSDIEDLECISCEMKYRDSADIDMFGA